jgi:hypothetical protein
VQEVAGPGLGLDGERRGLVCDGIGGQLVEQLAEGVVVVAGA